MNTCQKIVPYLAMRQLNRLNQFQRLWQPSEGAPQQATVAELAAHCFCSERHIRTLLGQLENAGWLRWRASAGRGRRGELSFLVSPDEVRALLMQQALDKGQQQSALALAQLAPEQLRHVLQPLLGGQWQNDIPTLRIPYYRPLESLTPGFLPGRAEQHLTSQIFAGLARFSDDSSQPQPDMAHRWQTDNSGTCWHFFLRPTLRWHDGESVSAEQILARLQTLMTQPMFSRLFASVAQIDAPHAWCLRFRLHQPDYWLPWRLASFGSRIAHPDDVRLGCGPFRLSHFDNSLVRLESHDGYHLAHPLLRAIEFWITPGLFDEQLGTSCRHPVQIAIGQQAQFPDLRPVSRSVSLGFSWLAIRQQGRLSAPQARYLMALIHQQGMLDALPLDPELITPSHTLLPGQQLPDFTDVAPVQLPPRLRLLYRLPVELHAMAQQLRRRLAELGCELELVFRNVKNWDDGLAVEEADLVMGDRLIGEAAEYTLEQWLRCDPLWSFILSGPQQAHIQATLDALQRSPETRDRNDALRRLFSRLVEQAIVTPLFNYRYQISAPPGVQGIQLNAWGWFDFSRAWLPPPGT